MYSKRKGGLYMYNTSTNAKSHYRVYQQDTFDYMDGRGVQNGIKTYLGDTWAVSEKKAVANIKFRLGITEADLFCAYAGDGYRRSLLIAERA